MAKADSPVERYGKGRESASERRYPCYLFYGEESYLVEDTAKRLIATLIPGEEIEFCREILSGPAVSPLQVAGALTTLPLFGGQRVAWLRGCGLFKSAERARSLLPLLPHPQCGITAVITEENVDRRSVLYKEIARIGFVRKFEALSETDSSHLRLLYDLVSEKIRADRVTITRDTLFSLVQIVGTDIRTILTEIEKCALHSGPGGTIEKSDIDLLVTPRRDAESFQLADAIAAGDLPRALAVMGRILSQGGEPLGIVGSLAQRIRFLLQVKELMGAGIIKWTASFPSFAQSLGRVPEAVRDAFHELHPQKSSTVSGGQKERNFRSYKRYNIFGQHPYVAYKVCEAARGIPIEKLRKQLDRVVKADGDFKGGRRSKKEALEDLVIALCG
ncbi:MAG: DNA polymerase III subunit delta [Candidatus Aureabacteria bacterium]|nr:DNA polymerase III subunit delta [Candidatus Auribacterota bacterium]